MAFSSPRIRPRFIATVLMVGLIPLAVQYTTAADSAETKPSEAVPQLSREESLAAIRALAEEYLKALPKADGELVADFIDPADRVEIHTKLAPVMAEAARLNSPQTRRIVANFYANIPADARANPSEKQATAGFFNFVLLGSPEVVAIFKSATFTVTNITLTPDGKEGTLTYTLSSGEQVVTTSERVRQTRGRWYLRTSMQPGNLANALRNSFRKHAQDNP